MSAILRLGHARVWVSRRALIEVCDVFAKNPVLAETDYCVRTDVTEGLFREFAGAIEGSRIDVTAENSATLSALSAEFGFGRLSEEVAIFQSGMGSDPELVSRIVQLEEELTESRRALAAVETEVKRLSRLAERWSILEERFAALQLSVMSRPAPDLPEAGPVPSGGSRNGHLAESNSRQPELNILKKLMYEGQRTVRRSVLMEGPATPVYATRRVVRALHVRSQGPYGWIPVDLFGLSATSGELEEFFIKVEAVDASAFRRKGFADWTLLVREFEVIFIGGTDAAMNVLGDLTQNVIDRSFVPYHMGGGKIVFLHDVTFGDEHRRWQYFMGQMGSYQQVSDLDLGLWSEVRLKTPSNPPPQVLTRPFRVTTPFPIAPTHSHQMSKSEHALLVGPRDSSTYYVERAGIAFIELGHTPSEVTREEWQFLVNVVYHLTDTRNGNRGPSR
jgi:hypothetical protein